MTCPYTHVLLRQTNTHVPYSETAYVSQRTIWLALAAYAIHILEEFVFDWRNRVRAVIGLPVEWSDC